MPKSLAPMHAEIAETAFNDQDWMWEPKLDGYRVLAFIDEKQIRMLSRNGLDFAKDFPKLAEELKQQAAPMVLDGEVVAFDAEGRYSFNAMQNRKSGAHVIFYCFDLLYFAGVDLRKLPYRDRAATSRSACCRRRSSSSCTPRRTARRSPRPRSRTASRA
jgi:bifunctional non-homologous end joining protein LigD